MTQKYLPLFLSIFSVAALGMVLSSSITAKGNKVASPDALIVIPQIVARDIPTFSKDASFIAVGTIQEIKNTYWNAEHSMIQKDAILMVSQVIKGDAQKLSIPVTLYGGTVDTKTIVYEDAPELVQGQKVLIFLGEDFEGKYVPYAQSMGVYTFISDEQIQDAEGKVINVGTLVKQIQSAL